MKHFHFFSYRTALRFHVTRLLEQRGWERAERAHDALFSDKNLTLDDDVSKNFEYKHLLAQLTDKYCPAISPKTYNINDENYQEICAKIIYEHYMGQTQYQRDITGLKWIYKPSMLNNGDGIKLFNNVQEIKAHYANPKRLGGEHVVQRYIANPDLIEGRKYTFRVMAVVTNFAGVYFYKKGYINISGYPFNPEDGFANRKAHITNYVLDGEFANIEQRHTQDVGHFPKIYSQMCDIVACTVKGLIAMAPLYLAPKENRVFELFGYDFILDQNGKVWLLEINQSPDAPTFEENPLLTTLWEPFWEDIVESFVLPIATGTSGKISPNFTRILSEGECYSRLHFYLDKIIDILTALKRR